MQKSERPRHDYPSCLYFRCYTLNVNDPSEKWQRHKHLSRGKAFSAMGTCLDKEDNLVQHKYDESQIIIHVITEYTFTHTHTTFIISKSCTFFQLILSVTLGNITILYVCEI
jgi:hypothetical protein